MGRSIDFNHQLGASACEVSNEWSNGMLAPKPPAPEATPLETRPHDRFSVSQRASHLTRELPHSRLGLHVCPPPPSRAREGAIHLHPIFDGWRKESSAASWSCPACSRVPPPSAPHRAPSAD